MSSLIRYGVPRWPNVASRRGPRIITPPTPDPPQSTGSASGTFDFAGSATGSRTPKAAGSGAYSFDGSATGSRAPQGAGSGAFAWAGSATGVAPTVGVSDGSGSGTYAFAGLASGVRTPKGAGSGNFAFSGSAIGQGTYAAYVTLAAAMSSPEVFGDLSAPELEGALR